jgi:hypothetical protein
MALARAAASDAEHQAAAAQMIEHAEFLIQPERVMERQDVDERSDPQPRGSRERGREKNAWARRHAERGGMVLGQMIAGEAFAFDQLDQPEPALEHPIELMPVGIQMIENAELQHLVTPRPAHSRRAVAMLGRLGGPSGFH